MQTDVFSLPNLPPKTSELWECILAPLGFRNHLSCTALLIPDCLMSYLGGKKQALSIGVYEHVPGSAIESGYLRTWRRLPPTPSTFKASVWEGLRRAGFKPVVLPSKDFIEAFTNRGPSAAHVITLALQIELAPLELWIPSNIS